jgi:hypothetical protein
MVSIQSLMDDRPYHNEPGFEKVGAASRVHVLRIGAHVSLRSSPGFKLTLSPELVCLLASDFCYAARG